MADIPPHKIARLTAGGGMDVATARRFLKVVGSNVNAALECGEDDAEEEEVNEPWSKGSAGSPLPAYIISPQMHFDPEFVDHGWAAEAGMATPIADLVPQKKPDPGPPKDEIWDMSGFYLYKPTVQTQSAPRLSLLADHGDSATTAVLVPSLGGLPIELLDGVLSYVTATADLFSCLLVCKGFRDIALPKLYHTLDITTTTAWDICAPNFVPLTTDSQANPGLQHVRFVRLRPEPGWEKNTDLKVILASLPPGQLEDFRWMSASNGFGDHASKLWEIQPQIRSLEIMTPPRLSGRDNNSDWGGGDGWPRNFIDEDGNEIAIDPDEDSDEGSVWGDSKSSTTRTSPADTDEILLLPRAKCIRQVPRTIDAVLEACKALQQSSITQLEIDLLHWEGPQARRNTGTGEVNDRLTEMLFGHLRLSNPTGPPSKWTDLRTLRLSGIDLRFSRDTWFRNLILVGLDHLSLEYCPNDEFFINELNSGCPLKLTTFSLLHNAGSHSSDRTIAHLDDFLSTMRKGRLRSLTLCLRNARESPDASAINGHHETLQHLALDVMTNIGHESILRRDSFGEQVTVTTDTYVTWELCTLLHDCNRLTQLAISTASAEFDFSSTGFKHNLSSIFRQAPKLRTLNLLNWPATYQPSRKIRYYELMLKQLKHLTEHIFSLNEKKQGKLEIVAFGTRERDGYIAGYIPKYFIRSEEIVLRQVKKSAAAVSLRNLVEEDMDVDILTYEWREFCKYSRRNKQHTETPFYQDVEVEPETPKRGDSPVFGRWGGRQRAGESGDGW